MEKIKNTFRGNINIFLYVLLSIILIIAFVSSISPRLVEKPQDNLTNYDLTENKDSLNVTITKNITSDMRGKTVIFYADDAFVSAYVGGENIYDFNKRNFLGKSPGSYYHIITIPEDSLYEQLLISVNYVYEERYNADLNFIIGYQNSIIFDLLAKDIAENIMTLFLIICTILIFVIYTIKKLNGRKDKSLFYFYSSLLFFICWSSSFTFTASLIFHNPLFLYYINYFSLFMFGLSIISYIDEITPKECYLGKIHMADLLSICFFSLLHLFHIKEFAESSVYIVLMTAVFIGISIVRMLINFKRIKDISNKVISLLAMPFIFLNGLVYILTTNATACSLITQVVILLIAAINVFINIDKLIKELATIKESELLRELVYKDELTKASNRYSLEKMVKLMELQNLSLVSLDLNNLKYYNDNYGHSCGDRLIKDASELIADTFHNVYRIGGDEFVVLLVDKTKIDLINLKEKLNNNIIKYNENSSDIKLEIACGFSSYQDGDISYEDILERADEEMYNNKKMLKSLSKIPLRR